MHRLLLTALLALVILPLSSYAQSSGIGLPLIAQLPTCSLSCLINALGKVGCTVGNVTCSCGVNRAQIDALATPCVVGNCTALDVALVRNITDQVCALAANASASSAIAASKTASTGMLATSSSMSATASGMATKSVVSSHTPIPTVLTSNQNTLSTGAKAGIGVGVGLGGLLVLGAVAWCIVGYRKKDRDLRHLAWIERRGTVRGRTELDGGGGDEMREVDQGDIGDSAPRSPVGVAQSQQSEEHENGEEAGDIGHMRRESEAPTAVDEGEAGVAGSSVMQPGVGEPKGGWI